MKLFLDDMALWPLFMDSIDIYQSCVPLLGSTLQVSVK